MCIEKAEGADEGADSSADLNVCFDTGARQIEPLTRTVLLLLHVCNEEYELLANRTNTHT